MTPVGAWQRLAPLVARAADQKKGEDILLLDVHRHSSITDFLLVVTVDSPAQIEAIETEICVLMESAGIPVHHRDGADSALWRVLDYGGLMVHLMHPQAREFYQLEKLYPDAPRRRWGERPPQPGRAGAPRRLARARR